MPEVVVSAVRFPNGAIRAVTRLDDGSTTEHDWFSVEETGLPPIQLPAGVMMKAFLDGGGAVGTADMAAYVVPNYAPTPVATAAVTPIPRPPSTEGVPEEISDRQFFQQLAIDEVISEDEAEATSGGAIPAALLTGISRLPSADQFGARMMVRNVVVFQRHHPMTVALGLVMGWTAKRMDALWTSASKL